MFPLVFLCQVGFVYQLVSLSNGASLAFLCRRPQDPGGLRGHALAEAFGRENRGVGGADERQGRPHRAGGWTVSESPHVVIL